VLSLVIFVYSALQTQPTVVQTLRIANFPPHVVSRIDDQWEWLIANDNVTFVSSAAEPDASRGRGASHNSAITNSVWCMAYKRGVGRGRKLPKSRGIVLHQGVQCRWAGRMNGRLIRA